MNAENQWTLECYNNVFTEDGRGFRSSAANLVAEQILLHGISKQTVIDQLNQDQTPIPGDLGEALTLIKNAARNIYLSRQKKGRSISEQAD